MAVGMLLAGPGVTEESYKQLTEKMFGNFPMRQEQSPDGLIIHSAGQSDQGYYVEGALPALSRGAAWPGRARAGCRRWGSADTAVFRDRHTRLGTTVVGAPSGRSRAECPLSSVTTVRVFASSELCRSPSASGWSTVGLPHLHRF